LPDDKDWTDLAEALPGFDLENIKFIVGGQREVLLSFLQEFYTESKGESLVVADLLRQGDTQAAKRVVHTLKGVSGSLGAMQLHTACDEFSNQLKLQCFEPATLEHWQAVFEQTMSSIKALNT
jgi:HPt (histidine-containing phosphotransfer) domain-containing protein